MLHNRVAFTYSKANLESEETQYTNYKVGQTNYDRVLQRFVNLNGRLHITIL